MSSDKVMLEDCRSPIQICKGPWFTSLSYNRIPDCVNCKQQNFLLCMVLKAGKSKSVAQASGVGLHAGSKHGGGGRKAVCGQASDEGGKSRQKSFFLWGNGSPSHPSQSAEKPSVGSEPSWRFTFSGNRIPAWLSERRANGGNWCLYRQKESGLGQHALCGDEAMIKITGGN